MKKKIISIALIGTAISACIVFFLNLNVTTKQCIDYRCHAIQLPLYLKTLDFFDRHFNYKQLVKKIIQDAKNDEERALKIFSWTYNNIKRNPEGLPIMDDHVWYTIVRGYGVDDQFQDVFTTLCHYAGLDAFFDLLPSEKDKEIKPLSFVKLGDDWFIFDAYNGVYFKNARGKMASVKDLSSGDWQIVSLSRNELPNYRDYFQNLNSINYRNYRSSRAALQSPLNRLIFWKESKDKK